MPDAGDLEGRVAALETQLHDLAERVQRSEQDAAAARVLAGGADRDVGEIRGEVRDFREHNNRVLNAMRDDLADLAGRMVLLTENTETGFAQVRAALDVSAAGQAHVVELLDQLIRRES